MDLQTVDELLTTTRSVRKRLEPIYGQVELLIEEQRKRKRPRVEVHLLADARRRLLAEEARRREMRPRWRRCSRSPPPHGYRGESCEARLGVPATSCRSTPHGERC